MVINKRNMSNASSLSFPGVLCTCTYGWWTSTPANPQCLAEGLKIYTVRLPLLATTVVGGKADSNMGAPMYVSALVSTLPITNPGVFQFPI